MVNLILMIAYSLLLLLILVLRFGVFRFVTTVITQDHERIYVSIYAVALTRARAKKRAFSKISKKYPKCTFVLHYGERI